jgi:alginate O-acetyltransferase complex protein AlgI
MNFISLLYALFLAGTLFFYWRTDGQQSKLWTIVISSLLFYALFYKDRPPLLLILNLSVLGTIIFVNFWIGKLLLESQIIEYRSARNNSREQGELPFLPRNKAERKRVVILGVAFNVLLLLGSKYIPFLLTTFAGLGFPALEGAAFWYRSNILPPLGISFLTFESIAYLVDVYKGSPATGNLLKYAAYKAFFPKLISGPITHYHEFSPQLNALKFPTIEIIVEGVWSIACGAVKKTWIADGLGTYVNLVWDPSNLERAGSIDLWLALFAYGWQLYFDFSGYVDIARGTSLFFGIKLPENFNFPYFSTNIADFWRRWHITLGDWLRHYIYFPLGGSHEGLKRTCLNLLAIMVIAGIWHGADWGFLVWGVVHGLALVIHRLTAHFSTKNSAVQAFWESRSGKFLGWLLTQPFVFMAWLFFRLPKLANSTFVLQNLWGKPADAQFAGKLIEAGVKLDNGQILACLLALSLVTGSIYYWRRVLKLEMGWGAKLFLIPAAFYLVWMLVLPGQGSPYIYFDF